MLETPSVSYSQRADILYVRLAEGKVFRTVALDDRRNLDLAGDGSLLGVEFIDASTGIELGDVPHHESIEAAIRNLSSPNFV